MSKSRDWIQEMGGSGEDLKDVLEDPDSGPVEVTLRRRFLSWRFAGYLAGCLFLTLTCSGASVALWSDMGCGTACVEYLQERHGYAKYCIGVVVLLGLALYLLDFFCPPHLPGRYLELAEGSKAPGRVFLAVAGAATLAGCFLSARAYPTLPMVVTISLAPLSLILMRRMTMPDLPEMPKEGAAPGSKDLEGRMSLLKLLTWEERDEKNFYSAATYSFLLAGLLSLCCWIPWAVSHELRYESQIEAASDSEAKELVFVRWAAPVIVAGSQFVFAGFACLRVTLNRAYSATDEVKNQLILDAKAAMNRELMSYRIAALRARLAASNNQRDVLKTTEDRLQQYFVQHISHMRQLSNIVKSVLLMFAVLMGALHIVFMVSPASHMGGLIQSLMGSFLMTFVTFIFVSFNRLSKSMSMALLGLPLWTSVCATCQADWVRGLGLSLAPPIAPLLLLLAAANQAVRRCRDLAAPGSALTERARSALVGMRTWDWVRVIHWCYVWAGVLIVYRATPVLLNVLLAWMTAVIGRLSFAMILAATFLAGVFLFMLPPVPGPAVYPFAGILISKSCPWGFWWGCAVCVLLCFLLKLAACCVQQKIIGERLGSSLAVRRACGVHKPFIRAIEAVLRRPGMSYGKCMILCGGPDWPTSVLAGILRLSVLQCLLGTVPIIFSIIPLALTGSFYLRREESEVWLRTGNLMLTLTALVSAVFWVGIGRAVQGEYDRNRHELTRPKEEYLELEWLDHAEGFLAGKCRTSWAEVPRVLRVPYAGGAACAALVGHAFLWRSANCFGSFGVTDDIATLRWLGPGGLVRPSGCVGLLAGVLSYAGLAVYATWHKRRTAAAAAEARRHLSAVEASWKEEWLRKLRLPPGRRQQQDGASSGEGSSSAAGTAPGEEKEEKEAEDSSPIRRLVSTPVMPKRSVSRVLLGAGTMEQLQVYGHWGSSKGSCEAIVADEPRKVSI